VRVLPRSVGELDEPIMGVEGREENPRGMLIVCGREEVGVGGLEDVQLCIMGSSSVPVPVVPSVTFLPRPDWSPPFAFLFRLTFLALSHVWWWYELARVCEWEC
jgi:hypothetical protein